MKIIWVQIQGYRRFAEPTSVRLIERLIALVGQNESGKTTFLDALVELNSNDEIADRNQTRRIDTPTEIKVTFELDETDQRDLNQIEDGELIEQCTLIKRENGSIDVELDPKPSHDLDPRRSVRSQLISFKDSSIAQKKIGGNVLNHLETVTDILNSDEDYLGEEEINIVREPISDLKNVAKNLENDEEADPEPIENVIESLEEFVEHEKQSPPQRAREILRRRRPKFLKFGERQRELKTTYDLKEEVPDPPPALGNLSELAGLNLGELREAAISENIALRDDLIEEANEILKSEFSEAWVRSDVVPVLSVDGTVLHINVRTPDEGQRSPIDQRSDGLRWFIALLSFIYKKESAHEPVLLVDEAESHLSYDAQADLIEVLETQEIAQKVIYTTHSAGCLPSDLGTGIRPVIQQEGERSTINNGFWIEGPGFKPLMLAMGLSPLAYSVARNSIIAEGPSETILLPTMLRQATGQDKLPYQVAPGASNVANETILELLSETGQSVILLDGDDEGDTTKENLVAAGTDEEIVRTYRDLVDETLVFEDLIDATEYAQAVNRELSTYQDPDTELTPVDLPQSNRPEAVEDWCLERGLDPVMKPNVCQRIVESASQGSDVFHDAHLDLFEEIDQWAKEHFVLFEGDD